MKHVALLRGINVGGKNKVPMQDLVAIFTAVGCTDVKTFINSGNVVFAAPATLLKKIPELVTAAIQKKCGCNTPVVMRSAKEMRAAFENNPFMQENPEENALHVMFLGDAPSAKLIQSLDPTRNPPERFIVRGKDIYLHMPKGMGQTKLTNAYFDSKLKTVSTARNWRTVAKLVELAEA
jgi:uncharacterized protein (DUF1697 family)